MRKSLMLIVVTWTLGMLAPAQVSAMTQDEARAWCRLVGGEWYWNPAAGPFNTFCNSACTPRHACGTISCDWQQCTEPTWFRTVRVRAPRGIPSDWRRRTR
jgi:hypothetical protein